MFSGFKAFILRGNVIELAVAVVVGTAFTALVNAIVTAVINPAIGALFSAESLSTALVAEIPTLMGDEPAKLMFGAVVAALLNFLIVAAVVYFALVMPMNALARRAEAARQAGQPVTAADEPPTELELLGEIRDLLARRDGGAEPAETPDSRS